MCAIARLNEIVRVVSLRACNWFTCMGRLTQKLTIVLVADVCWLSNAGKCVECGQGQDLKCHSFFRYVIQFSAHDLFIKFLFSFHIFYLLKMENLLGKTRSTDREKEKWKRTHAHTSTTKGREMMVMKSSILCAFEIAFMINPIKFTHINIFDFVILDVNTFTRALTGKQSMCSDKKLLNRTDISSSESK